MDRMAWYGELKSRPSKAYIWPRLPIRASHHQPSPRVKQVLCPRVQGRAVPMVFLPSVPFPSGSSCCLGFGRSMWP